MRSATLEALLLLLAMLASPVLWGYRAGAMQGIGSDSPKAFVDPEVYSVNSSRVEVLVVMKPIDVNGLPRQQALALLRDWSRRSLSGLAWYITSLGGEVRREFWIVPALVAVVPKEAITRIASYPGVVEVIANTEKFHVEGTLKPVGGEAYQAVINWGVKAVNATAAWRKGYTGLGVRIAVLDTGVDPDHPALAGKLLTLVPGDPTYPGGWIEFDSDGNPLCTIARDTHWHGTFVASIALGGDTNTTIVGVAPEAQLMAALVLPQGQGTPAQVLAGFEWAADPYTCHGNHTGLPPHVVVFSAGWKGYTGTFLLDAIKTLLELGIIVVASIGNYGPGVTEYPGNVWGVYGVGAVNQSLVVANFSSGALVAWANPPQDWPFKPPYPTHYVKPDFTAPGVNVGGAMPGSSSYGYANGTSFAAPHVAGAVALVLQALGALNFTSPIENTTLPELVYDILANTSIDLGAAGLDDRYGWGLVNAGEAVELTLRLTRRIPVKLIVNPPRVRVGGELNITILPKEEAIPNGTTFTIYLDGHPIARAIASAGRASTLVKVPETPMGPHVVMVTSPAGFSGNASIAVEPSIEIEPRVAEPGTSVYVKALGHAANETYTVLLDGYEAAKIHTNPNGTGYTSISIPPSMASGIHVIQTIASTGLVMATANLTVAVEEQLNVEIAAAPGYEGEALVYILTAIKGEPVNASVEAYAINGGSIARLHVARVSTGLYTVRARLNSTYTLLLVEAYYTAKGYTAHGAAIALLYNDTTHTRIVGELDSLLNSSASMQSLLENLLASSQGINASMQALLNASLSSSKTLSEMLSLLTSLNGTLTTLATSLTYINETISTINFTTANTLSSLTRLNTSVETLGSRLSNIAASIGELGEEVESSNAAVVAIIRSEAGGLQENITGSIKASQERIISTVREESSNISGHINRSGNSTVKAIIDSLRELEGSLENSIREEASLIRTSIANATKEVVSTTRSYYKSITAEIAGLKSLLESMKALLERAASQLEDLTRTCTRAPTTRITTTPPTTATSSLAGRGTATIALGAAAAAVLVAVYYILSLKRRISTSI